MEERSVNPPCKVIGAGCEGQGKLLMGSPSSYRPPMNSKSLLGPKGVGIINIINS